MFPLTVGIKNVQDENHQRREAAESLLNKMKEHSRELVEQAYLVSEELIRVAVLWNEQWHEGQPRRSAISLTACLALEAASKRYTEQDMEGMLQVLQPLHAKMKEMAGAATDREALFLQNYGLNQMGGLNCC